MNKGLLFVLLFFTTAVGAQGLNVLHYRFTLDLNDRNDTISGVTEITFLPGTPRDTVAFDLAGINSQGKGMQVLSVTGGGKGGTPLPFTHAGEIISIGLQRLPMKDTAKVQIAYRGVPGDGLIISQNKFGDRTFFSDNWPNRAHQWIPCSDRPDDKATFEFVVRAPAVYNVISNGRKLEEKQLGPTKETCWREDIPLPTKVMAIGVARFATKTFDNSNTTVPVSAWVYPQDSAKGFYDYAVAPAIAQFLSGYIAPFPYSKLANVQSTTIFGGMENASCIFYDEKLVTGDRRSEDIVAHEIAHQWFGDMASEKSFAHVWLSEGFATYFTNLYWEHKFGREAMRQRLNKDRQKVIGFAQGSTHAVVDSTEDLMYLLNANSYEKGGWILHMLRLRVGDALFQQIIRTYYNHYKGGNAETRDFEAVAENVSGQDLHLFFNQWLYKPGVPSLQIDWSAGANEVVLNISQSADFTFPLAVKLVLSNGKTVLKQLTIDKKVTSVRWPIGGDVISVQPDPDTELLANFAVRKRG